jgi:hypothetical protein
MNDAIRKELETVLAAPFADKLDRRIRAQLADVWIVTHSPALLKLLEQPAQKDVRIAELTSEVTRVRSALRELWGWDYTDRSKIWFSPEMIERVTAAMKESAP